MKDLIVFSTFDSGFFSRSTTGGVGADGLAGAFGFSPAGTADIHCTYENHARGNQTRAAINEGRNICVRPVTVILMRTKHKPAAMSGARACLPI